MSADKDAWEAAHEYVKWPENWPTMTAHQQVEAEVDAFLAGVIWANRLHRETA